MELHSYSLSSGTSCAVAPEMGCNVVSWVVNGREVFHKHEDFGRDPQKFYYGGNPVLFPCVGRTWDRSGPSPRFGIYRIHGMEGEFYMPLHGLMARAQCRRTREETGPERVCVEYEVSVDESVRRESYPFDLPLKLTYTLEAQSLQLTATIANRGDTAFRSEQARGLRPTVAPFAFGYHPWFATADPGRSGVEVRLPCASEVTIDQEFAVPDGGKKPFSGVFHFGPDIGYGGVYSDLTGSRTTMIDSIGKRAIHVDVDDNIAQFVIASPKQTPAVCVEPWTAGLGGWEALASPDWECATSLELLQPGATRTVEVRYTVEALT